MNLDHRTDPFAGEGVDCLRPPSASSALSAVNSLYALELTSQPAPIVRSHTRSPIRSLTPRPVRATPRPLSCPRACASRACGGREQQAPDQVGKLKVVNSNMPGVRVKEGESFENAMKRFKKQCEKAGILSEIRKREHYEKPSVKRKKKALAAKKRALKKMRKG